MRKMTLLAAFAAGALLLTACGDDDGDDATTQPGATESPAADLGLVEDGTLSVCSDVPYSPFEVEDPDGILVGVGTVAVAFSAGGVAFTIADGATDFVAGSGFYVDVTFSANADFIGVMMSERSSSLPSNAHLPCACTS